MKPLTPTNKLKKGLSGWMAKPNTFSWKPEPPRLARPVQSHFKPVSNLTCRSLDPVHFYYDYEIIILSLLLLLSLCHIMQYFFALLLNLPVRPFC